jgi:uncharacterized protein (DUF362 family)
LKRRSFVRTTLLGTVGTRFLPLALSAQESEKIPDAVRVDNGEPAQLLSQALLALGGMKHYISQGDIVVIKPNIGWARAPEFAADTNPDLVAAVVTACYSAGAKVVKVFDRSCNDPRRCYVISEIEKKAEAAGAEVSQVRSNKFAKIKLKSGKVLKEWEIYKDYLEADKIINIPIAKSHSLSRVTLGAKNLMGVIGGDRGLIHNGFDEKLADICGSILPTLTIIDAYRILLTNGPTGGNPADVKLQKSLIASKCMVTADYLGLDFFSLHINQVGHLREMVDRGLNQFDLNKLNVKKIVLDS